MTDLPIDKVIPEILSTLQRETTCVLQAEPGAGKTTRVPLALLTSEYLQDQRIIMLEPRRIAARGAAEFMAQQLNETCGETVGYRMRQDSKIGPKTRIEVVTEGVFLRMLHEDPSLEGVGLVIFDEFHERNMDSDVALALVLQSRELFRDQHVLRLLVMSATLDTEPLAQFLNCPVISSEGRSFPVEVVFHDVVIPRKSLLDAIFTKIKYALEQHAGSVLVFLPGQSEITQLQQRLQERFAGDDSLIIAPLYGQLPMENQRHAIKPAPVSQRKVVLATNIAESSITIEGVDIVIDSGWSKVSRYDANNGMSRLHYQRISKASAVQRSGRAGRVAAGVCYRMWTAQQQHQLHPYDVPELLQADLTTVAIRLLAWGCQTLDELEWLDKPKASAFSNALQVLQSLDAIDHQQLTPHGELIAEIPTHPRLAHMLLRGAQWGVAFQAAQLVALLEERDPLRQAGVDIDKRVQWLSHGGYQAKRMNSRVQQLLKLVKNQSKKSELSSAVLLAQAFPDRIAQLRSLSTGEYKLANGRGVALDHQDDLFGQKYLLVADVGGAAGRSTDTIFLAAALDEEEFKQHLAGRIVTQEVAQWNDRLGRFEAERRQCWGELVISKTPMRDVGAELVVNALLAHIENKGLDILPWNEQTIHWLARAKFVERYALDPEWPQWDDQSLMESLSDWLGPFIGHVKNLDALKKIDLKNILQARLNWNQQQMLEDFAPCQLKVPTGRHVSIDYCGEQPVLAVRMQEMFGCPISPTVANGKVKVLLHLLSPAQRPLAVTSDLASFWQNAYQDVKKDMKGRYPKHYWPDDPQLAAPTQVTKAKMQKT